MQLPDSRASEARGFCPCPRSGRSPIGGKPGIERGQALAVDEHVAEAQALGLVVVDHEARSVGTVPATAQTATLVARQESPAGPTPSPDSPLSQTIAPQLQGLVQQQLEALATQSFSWQGQIWPGQDMQWEIDENAGRRSDAASPAPAFGTDPDATH